MDREIIRDQLFEIFDEYSHASREELVAGQALDEMIDSIAIAEIIFAIEDRFDIELGDDEARAIRTFDDVVDGIRGRLGSAGSA